MEAGYIKARAKGAVPTEVFYLGKKELKFGGETIRAGGIIVRQVGQSIHAAYLEVL